MLVRVIDQSRERHGRKLSYHFPRVLPVYQIAFIPKVLRSLGHITWIRVSNDRTLRHWTIEIILFHDFIFRVRKDHGRLDQIRSTTLSFALQCRIVVSRPWILEEVSVHCLNKYIIRFISLAVMIWDLNVNKRRSILDEISSRSQCGLTRASRCCLPIGRPWWHSWGWCWDRKGHFHLSRKPSWRC